MFNGILTTNLGLYAHLEFLKQNNTAMYLFASDLANSGMISEAHFYESGHGFPVSPEYRLKKRKEDDFQYIIEFNLDYYDEINRIYKKYKSNIGYPKYVERAVTNQEFIEWLFKTEQMKHKIAYHLDLFI